MFLQWKRTVFCDTPSCSAMVVYGFLTYHDGSVSIPNHELMLQFERVLGKINAVEELG